MTDEVKKPRKKPTERRSGPPCPTCGRSQTVSDVPKDQAALERLKARAARDLIRLQKAEGIVVKPIEPKTEEPS